MFVCLKLYWRDWWNNIPLFLLVGIQVFIWFYIIFNIKPAMELVFLHYNIIFGVDLVGSWWKVYYLPLAGLLVLLVNCTLSFIFYKTDKFLSRLLNFWSLLFHLFLLMVVILLVGLNV